MLSCPSNIVSLTNHTQQLTKFSKIFSNQWFNIEETMIYNTWQIAFNLSISSWGSSLWEPFTTNSVLPLPPMLTPLFIKRKKKIKTHYQLKPCFPNQSRNFFFFFSNMRETHLAESRLEASQNEGLDWDWRASDPAESETARAAGSKASNWFFEVWEWKIGVVVCGFGVLRLWKCEVWRLE